MSKNVLGDLGVHFLITPLIRKHLQAMSIVALSTPTVRDKLLTQGKDVKSAKPVFKQIPINSDIELL